MGQSNTVQVEVWVMVDENGSYEVAKEAGDLQAGAGECCRFVKLTVKVPKPQPVELTATIEAEPEAAQLRIA
ncbi:MAG TPA: hypothetical protein VGE74_20560 [Gemmata sp.]